MLGGESGARLGKLEVRRRRCGNGACDDDDGSAM